MFICIVCVCLCLSAYRASDPGKVAKVRSLVSLPADPVKIHLDSWAIKKLFSLALRRSGADKDELPQRKDCGFLELT